MIRVNENLYSVKEILQENYTDFDIVRERPLTFHSGGQYLVCAPVRYYEHPRFIKELCSIIGGFHEILSKVEWLSSQDYKEDPAVTRAVNQITLFSNTASYDRFINKALHGFISRWAYTIRKNKLIRIPRRKAKRILGCFSVDELIQVFFTIFVFNYDIVRKKNFDLFRRLRGNPADTMYSGSSGEKRTVQMPKYSPGRSSRSTLELFVQQSRMH